MNEILAIWAEWIRPSAGLPTVQWSILLALAAAAGHLVNRYTGLPKVIGYSAIGAFAGLAGFTGAIWPLQGIGLFLLELGVAVVLFEAGGHISLRWSRHNPMVLVQSLAESALTYILVYWVLGQMGMRDGVAEPLALLAMAASPAVLSRVAIDTRGAGRAADLGGADPLAALLGGKLLKQLNPRPWSWPRQMGTASSMLTMLMFVLVSVVAARADWSGPVAGLVLALIAARLLAKIAGM